MQTWAYDGTTTFLRQPLSAHYEAPFLVLLSGSERSLLIDTGTGHVDVRGAVDAVARPELLVAHSHTHSDHVGGDPQFVGRAKTAIVPHGVADVRAALGDAVDLGGRVVDVIPIPGHEAAHVAFYDRATEILFTGDTLYPGRLYVRDWGAYRASIARLVDFVETRPVSHVIGAHIEMDSAEVEYAPESAAPRANEHGMLMTVAHLRALHVRLGELGDKPARSRGRDWVIVPVES